MSRALPTNFGTEVPGNDTKSRAYDHVLRMTT